MDTREIIISGVIPGAIAFAALTAVPIVARLISRTNTDKPTDGGPARAPARFPLTLVPALLLALTLPLGAYAFTTRWTLWAVDSKQKFITLGLTAAAAGLIIAVAGALSRQKESKERTGASSGAPWWIIAAVGLPVAAFFGWAMLSPLSHTMSTGALYGWIAAIAGIGAAQATLIELAARRLPAIGQHAVVWALGATAAMGTTQVLVAGTMLLSPIAAIGGSGIAAAALLLIAGRVKPSLAATPIPAAPGVPAAAALYTLAVLLFGQWYAEPFGTPESWRMFALIAVTPAAAGIVLLPPLSGVLRSRPIARAVVAAGAILAVGGTQAAIAIPALLESQSADEFDYYDY